MSKKMRNNIIACGAMVVLSFGIIMGIKFANGDFGAKENKVSISVDGFTSQDATVSEAFCLLDDADQTTGYVVTVSAVGFNAASPIVMNVTFGTDKTTIQKFEVADQQETQGLGGNVATPEFQAAFEGVTAPVYTGTMDANGTAFDQITGATISSVAVANAINAASEFLATVE